MIGFVLLVIASASLIAPGCAQDYDELRPARATYRGSYDDEDTPLTSKKQPVTVTPILKQIDRHNDDGSYTYGFESADGSFKIETKQANGEVKGKYGYTDADGKLYIVEYGADRFGFQPSGEGITVPPVNFNAEPEPEELEEELPRRIPANIQPKPRPQVIQPRPLQLESWEQNVVQNPIQLRPQAPAPAPIPAPAPAPRPALRTQVIVPQSRPKPKAEPHIIYNSPTPKRPTFFAGAQPIPAEPAQNVNFDYEEPAPRAIPRPAARPAPRAQTLAITRPKPQQNFFVPNAEFRQETQYSQPQPKIVRPSFFEDDDSQFYSPPQPAKARYVEPAPAPAPVPAPRAYKAPKVSKSQGGFLDQLEEQYSLPSSGQPTHNIAFGFY